MLLITVLKKIQDCEPYFVKYATIYYSKEMTLEKQSTCKFLKAAQYQMPMKYGGFQNMIY